MEPIDTVVEFNVPGCGSQYLDLKNTKLHMKLQITKPDGTAIGAADAVGLVAAPLSSMFSQVNIQLQQENITASDSLYPFKAYTEKLLNTCTGAGHPQSEAELHFLDGSPGLGTGNNMDQAEPEPKDPKLKNHGLTTRAQYTSLGRTVDLEGPLHCDICQQERYILNSVDLRVRLSPSQNDKIDLATAIGSQRSNVAS